MARHIPFYTELLGEGATTNEILLYGLIEASSFAEGFCYASSDYMAAQIGVAPKTIRNLLSILSKRGWIHVEIEGNKRIAITPLLGLTIKKKRQPKVVENPVENSSESVPLQGHYRPATRTLPSRQRDALNREVTGKGIIINNNIIKENNKRKEIKIDKKSSPAGTAGNGPASRLKPKRKDFENDLDYEKAFYRHNTIYLGAL